MRTQESTVAHTVHTSRYLVPYLLHRDRGLWISNPGLNACFPMLDCFLACFLRTGTHDNLEPGSPGRASLDWRRGRLPAVRPPPQAVRSSGGAPGVPLCIARISADPGSAALAGVQHRFRASILPTAGTSAVLWMFTDSGVCPLLLPRHPSPVAIVVLASSGCCVRYLFSSSRLASHPSGPVASPSLRTTSHLTSHASAGRDMPASKLLQDQQYQSARVQASISSRPSTS